MKKFCFLFLVPIFIGLTACHDDEEPEKKYSYRSCPNKHHPHKIDLGLPSGTLWACCNVGASSPEGYGGYYAWGETEEKVRYDWENYKYCDGSAETCHDLGTNIIGSQYDVAHVKWGDSWQMPNLDQFNELYENCTHTWVYSNGIYGCRYTGPNGGSIFIPFSGFKNESGFKDRDLQSVLWFGTKSDDSYAHSFEANSFTIVERMESITGYGFAISNCGRYYGLSVRPVAK